MKYGPKEIRLRDGRTAVLRAAEPEDAAALLEHRILTSGETLFMARYPDELTSTVEEQREYLERLLASPGGCNICAFIDGELAASGGIDLVVPDHFKYAHRAGFGISVKQKFWHLGLGRAVTLACVEAAREAGYEILELDAVADNVRAIALYESVGFRRIGVRPRAFRFRDGSYADEVMMTLEL